MTFATALTVGAAVPARADVAYGTLQGTVNGDGAGPVAGANVIPISEEGYQVGDGATSDAQGDYSVRVETGTYRLAIQPPAGSEWGSQMWDGVLTTAEATEVDITADSVATADVTLTLGSTVSGRVTCDGVPTGGITVGAVNRINLLLGRSAVTEPDGTYAITGVIPGNVEISFQPFPLDCIPEFWKDVPLGGTPTPLLVTEGQDRTGIDGELSSTEAPEPAIPAKVAAVLKRLGIDATDPRIAAACTITTDSALQRRIERLGANVSLSTVRQARAALC
ncbi:carboxypeptidase-like regulatory domain-containing protein [Rathayibacter festucae]|uniref:carboxypeptidase-like regulatory domain-containing protein n=1 Tax=Rathayibacter festucae TaxID=110937 RepID=UPI002A6B5D6A|nr:carboxypeptidase-like regulatory domain-containing protein [Rathayibacter festucae]MDY0911933.1 carboxypeptidase-like regulatory domain-containing protein [Rathayibacter festucae]